MASVCFVYVCDVHHVDKQVWICFWQVVGETTGKGTPSPFRGRATVRLPPSKFFYFSKQIFYFFLPHPHNIAYSPILFVPERFSLPLCVFPYPCIFSCLWGQKNGFSYPTCVYAVIMRSTPILYYFLLLCFSVVFLSCISLLFCSPCYVFALSFVVDAVFFADLPILLPSVGLSLLLCVIIHLSVFRVPEAKK